LLSNNNVSESRKGLQKMKLFYEDFKKNFHYNLVYKELEAEFNQLEEKIEINKTMIKIE